MEALESRRQQSKLELDAAARQRALEEEAARRKAERAAQEKDRMARQAQERLEQLRASWAENKALQEVSPHRPKQARPLHQLYEVNVIIQHGPA